MDISSYAGLGAGENPSSTLLVSGLISSVSYKELKKHFSKFGEVLEVVRPKEAEGARWAFIHFKDCKSVETALGELQVVGGQLVDCRRAYDYRRESKTAEEAHKKPIETVKKPVAQKPAPTPVKAPEPLKKTEPSVVADKDIADVTKFLISHLTPKTTTEMLKKHFSKYGTVLDA